MGCWNSLSSEKINEMMKEENAKLPIILPVKKKWSWESTTIDRLTWYKFSFTIRTKEQLGDILPNTILAESTDTHRANGNTCSAYTGLGLLGVACFAGGVYLALSNIFIEKNNRLLGMGGIALGVIGLCLSIFAAYKHQQVVMSFIYPKIRQQYADILIDLNNSINQILSTSTPTAQPLPSAAPIAVSAPMTGVTLTAAQYQQLLTAASQNRAAAPMVAPTGAFVAANQPDYKSPLLDNEHGKHY